MKVKKSKKRELPQILTPDEISLLLSSFNPRYKTSLRNRLLIEFALKTGMRISELSHLKWSDVEVDTGRIHIKEGKGKKDRIIYSSPELLSKIKAMNSKFKLKVNTYVFPSSTGGPFNITTLQIMLKARAAKLGLKKRVYFHLLRHTCLTSYYAKSKNIRLVQQIAGHSDISTTMIYTHISPNEVKEIMLE